MSTCTQEPTYFTCVFEEPSCYCRQVLHQRASQAVSMYALWHADIFTTGVKRPVAINCKTQRSMWRCAFLCNHQMDGVDSSLENHRSWANWSAGYKPADQKENEADSQPAHVCQQVINQQAFPKVSGVFHGNQLSMKTSTETK